MQKELGPIENAINTVTSKTRELQRSIKELKEDDKRNINPLSMQLKGVIDAAVNGGIVNYKNVRMLKDPLEKTLHKKLRKFKFDTH